MIIVVIVNFNSGTMLSECLDCLQTQELVADQIIVVDNNCSDDSLQNLPPMNTLNIVKIDDNLGFAAANNRALLQIPDESLVITVLTS
ncbi:MAG TPA: glycosyltransferase [Pseudomonadales bacterium]|nr:glycosyltransferase [Pseudomonadales bacterium]